MSKREELREKRRQQQVRQRTLIIILVVAGALIITGILVYPTLASNLTPVGAITPVADNPRPNADGLTIGSSTAPVKVIEYADFQCPSCKYYNDNMDSTMLQNYVSTGKVQFTYMPFSFIGAESVAAAEAAYCANDQGKFWHYHDILYANQGSENTGNFSDRRLAAFAQSVGLDMTKFNSCYSSHKYQQKVQQDLSQGDSLQVTQTPSFFVNGKLVTADVLFQTIDDDIKTAPAK